MNPRDNVPSESARRQVSASGTSDSVFVFKFVLWTLFAIDAFSIAGDIAQPGETEVVSGIVIGLAILGFFAWLNVMLLHGRNWARMTWLAINVVVFPVSLSDILAESPLQKAIWILSCVLTVWALRMMFTDPLKRRFQKS